MWLLIYLDPVFFLVTFRMLLFGVVPKISLLPVQYNVWLASKDEVSPTLSLLRLGPRSAVCLNLVSAAKRDAGNISNTPPELRHKPSLIPTSKNTGTEKYYHFFCLVSNASKCILYYPCILCIFWYVCWICISFFDFLQYLQDLLSVMIQYRGVCIFEDVLAVAVRYYAVG